MERLLTIMKKEFFHIWRDPRTMALIIALPVMLLVLLGYGVSGETKNIPMAVADFSKTDASRRYIEYFTTSGDFEFRYTAFSEDELINLIDTDRAEVGLLIPEDFGRRVDTGKTAVTQFYINGSDPSIAQTTALKIGAIGQIVAQDLLVEQLTKATGGLDLQIPINSLSLMLYNPNSDPGLFMIPGLIPIILQVQTLLLTALAIVREREQGTMEQLIVTPIKSWELMLGKIIPYLMVCIFNTLVMLWLGQLIFGISAVGSVWELVGLSTVFILGSLGLGVLISNVSRTQMQAMYLAVGVVLIPAIILSGLIISRSGMPRATYLFSELLPVTHFLEITRGIMLKGVGAEVLWPSIWPLIVLSVVYFTASVLAFRKRL
ncbi:MAG: ABC transporter permease [Chloroflexi bacterium]|nr:ABC transporter permease [Chloroflexota bacterium]MBU1661402.1 ABC transporter permease [Chloroflexota bacterium]